MSAGAYRSAPTRPDFPGDPRRNHGESERLLRDSGMAHTVLRCNDFMQNLLFSAATIAEGELYSTEIAGGKLASVDVRDIVALVERTVSPIACHIAGRRSSESRGTIGLRSPGTLVLRQEYLRSNGPIQ